MTSPLVTVICLCYNHERFVRAAIDSVVKQSYPHLQIIVWDDASSDSSPTVIRELQQNYPQLQVTLSEKNEGNCRAFNHAYALAKGEFIIDFSTDDIMHEQRISKQVDLFRQNDEHTGVVFTDATYIGENNVTIRHHYEHLFEHGLINEISTGDVFQKILTTYYIASPTMMMRRIVLDTLGGYDEQLTYEDFDLCVRSSRLFQYAYLNERLSLIRVVSNSLSAGQYAKGSPHLFSTYQVCKKAIDLCRNDDDRKAVIKRLQYELRQATISDNAGIARKYWQLLRQQNSARYQDRLWLIISLLRLPLSGVRRLYHKISYGR